MKSLYVLGISMLIGSCKTTSHISHPILISDQVPVEEGYTHEKMLESQRSLAKSMENWSQEAIEDFKRRYIFDCVRIITKTDTITYGKCNESKK